MWREGNRGIAEQRGPELVSRLAKELEAGKRDDAEGPHGLAHVKESDE